MAEHGYTLTTEDGESYDLKPFELPADAYFEKVEFTYQGNETIVDALIQGMHRRRLFRFQHPSGTVNKQGVPEEIRIYQSGVVLVRWAKR